MLLAKSLKFSYQSGRVFNFPNIALQDNEHLLIVGKSGIGNSTLLQILTGIITPEEGVVKIGNIELTALKSSAKDRFRGSNVGIVFQKPSFVKSLSLLENYKLIQHVSGTKPDLKRISELLLDLNLSVLMNKKPVNFSQGEQQRSSIGMALLNNPKLIIADEPTSSLDDENAFDVIQILKKHALSNDANLIIITHDNRVKENFDNVLEL